MPATDAKKERKMSKTCRIILGAITVVALLAVIAGINRPKLNPFAVGVDSMFSVGSCKSDDGGAIIDSKGKRILFTNPQDQLIGVVDLTKSGSPIDKALKIEIDGDKVVVYGCAHVMNGIYISSESVLEYDLKGRYLGERDRIEYGEDELVTESIFMDSIDFEAIKLDSDAIFVSEFIYYSAGILIINILYWLSVVWIVLLGAGLVAWLVIKKSTRDGIMIMITVGCVLITAIYYTLNNYSEIRNHYENAVVKLTKEQVKFTNDRMGETLCEISRAVDEQGADYLKQEETVKYSLDMEEEIVSYRNLANTENSFSTLIYILDSDENCYIFMDSRGLLPVGKEVKFSAEDWESILNHNSDEAKYISGVGYDLLEDFDFIYDSNGKKVAAVQVFVYEDNILATQSERGVNVFVNLLALLIGLFMVIKLFFVYKDDIKRWASREKTDISARAADMSGIYMFVFKLTSTIDEVIAVYVATSLCEDIADPALQATLVALPISAYGLGRWVGTFFATPIIKKAGERLAGIIGCVIGIGSMLLLAFSIQISNIYIYTLGKLISGIVITGVMYVLSDTLPLSATSEKQRAEAINSSQKSVSASDIITALISGYIAAYVGYSFVYIIGAIICVALLLLTVMIYGRKVTAMETQAEIKDNKSLGDYWKIFLKPEFLMYLIFYLVPLTLTGGYKSYLFPLYSAGAGISVVLLSNLSVFSKTAEYLTGDYMTKLANKMGTTKSMVVSQLIISGGLVCFLISPNIYWAIIMLFVSAIFKRMSSTSSKMYRVNVSEYYGMDAKLVSSNFYTIESAVHVFQSPALSAFIGLGMNLACAAVGIVSGVGCLIFGGYTKKKNHIYD